MPRLNSSQRKGIAEYLRSKVGAEGKLHILEGDPVVTILRLARTLRPDLIVMGTNGRTGFERLWVGSVTEAVVRLSPVPVLVARGEPKSIESVLAPVNFTTYSEYGFIFAAKVAVSLAAKLIALHIVDDPKRFPNPKYRLTNLVSRLSNGVRQVCKPEVLIQRGAPTEEILKAAEHSDLVILIAHRKPLLEDMVFGMTAERVLRLSKAPVLTVPSQKNAAAWKRVLPQLKELLLPV